MSQRSLAEAERKVDVSGGIGFRGACQEHGGKAERILTHATLACVGKRVFFFFFNKVNV